MAGRLQHFRACVILAITWSVVCLAPDPVAWTPQLGTTSGRLTLLQSIIARHPNILRRNLQFRRNLLSVMNDFDTARKAAGDQAVDLEIGPTQLRGARFFAVTDVVYNEEQLTKLREKIKKDIAQLGLTELRGLKEDLAALKNGPNAAEFKTRAAALLRAAPFLYDSSLKPRSGGIDAARRSVDEATPPDLQNRYFELMRDSIAPAVTEVSRSKGMGDANAVLAGVESNFVQKEVRQATEGRTPTGASATLRAVSIERAAAPIAVMRGCFGGDCSILSVPHFPSLKGTKTFLVRKSMRADAEPDGYAFVAEVMRGGKIVPYIVTINGEALQAADVQAVIHLVAEQYGSKGVIVGDLAKHPHLVNTQAVRSTLSPSKKTATKVTLPEGWDIFADPKYRAPGYANYYARENLENGYWVDLAEVPFRQEGKTATTEVKAPYLPIEDVKKISRLDRAVLAAHATESSDEEREALEAQVLKELDLEAKELKAGRELVGVSPEAPMSKAQFQRFQTTLGLKAADLLSLDVLTRVASLSNLHHEAPEIATADEWKKFFKRTTDQLDREVIVELEGKPGQQVIRLPTDHHGLKAWLKAQLSVPLQFRSALLTGDALSEEMAQVGERDLGEQVIAELTSAKHANDPLARKWLEAIANHEKVRAQVSDVKTKETRYQAPQGGSAGVLRWITLQRALPRELRAANAKQLAAGERLAQASAGNPLYPADLYELKRELGFDLHDVTSLPALSALASLRSLNNRAPELASEAEWKRLFKKTGEALDQEYLQSGEQDGRRVTRLNENTSEAWLWLRAQLSLAPEHRSPFFTSAELKAEIVEYRNRWDAVNLLELLAQEARPGDPTVAGWLEEFARLERERVNGEGGKFRLPTARGELARWYRVQKALPEKLRSPRIRTNEFYEMVLGLKDDKTLDYDHRVVLEDGIAEMDKLLEQGKLSQKLVLALIELSSFPSGPHHEALKALVAKAARLAAQAAPGSATGAGASDAVIDALRVKLTSPLGERFRSGLEALLDMTQGKEIPKDLAEIIEKRLRSYDESVMPDLFQTLRRKRKYVLPISLLAAITDIAVNRGSGAEAARSYLKSMTQDRARLPEVVVAYMAEGMFEGQYEESMARWLLTTHSDSPTIRALNQQMTGRPDLDPNMPSGSMKKLFGQKICKVTYERLMGNRPPPVEPKGS